MMQDFLPTKKNFQAQIFFRLNFFSDQNICLTPIFLDIVFFSRQFFSQPKYFFDRTLFLTQTCFWHFKSSLVKIRYIYGPIWYDSICWLKVAENWNFPFDYHFKVKHCKSSYISFFFAEGLWCKGVWS